MSKSITPAVITVKNDAIFDSLTQANEQFSKYRELLDIINPPEMNETYDYCNWNNTLTIVPNK